MALYQFTSTPNTGALRTSKVSKGIYKAAISECVFMQFVAPEPFGTGMGQSVTIPGEAQMTELTDYSLSETDRVRESTHTVDGKVVTIGEYGNSIPWSRLADDLSVFDLRSSVQRDLKNDLKLFLDSHACAAFKQTQYKYTPTGVATASTATNGTAPTSATANLNVYHVGAIRDILFGTYKAPMVDGAYIAISTTLGCRGVKNDPDWEIWHQYAGPEAKFNSEIGKIEGVRFVETNHFNSTLNTTGSMTNGIGTSSVLGETLVFGDEATVLIESAAPEIIPGQPDDFGRVKSLAWYTQMKVSLKSDSVSAGRLRVVHVTST